jgi:hypothetical protein
MSDVLPQSQQLEEAFLIGAPGLYAEVLEQWEQVPSYVERFKEVSISGQHEDLALNLYSIDLETFQAWLQEGAQTGGIAGTTCQFDACPLARFLVDLYGGSWVVNSNEYELLSPDFYEIYEIHPLPSWASRFVLEVDVSTDAEGEPVSYTDVLSVLSQVLKEEVSHG